MVVIVRLEALVRPEMRISGAGGIRERSDEPPFVLGSEFVESKSCTPGCTQCSKIRIFVMVGGEVEMTRGRGKGDFIDAQTHLSLREVSFEDGHRAIIGRCAVWIHACWNKHKTSSDRN